MMCVSHPQKPRETDTTGLMPQTVQKMTTLADIDPMRCHLFCRFTQSLCPHRFETTCWVITLFVQKVAGPFPPVLGTPPTKGARSLRRWIELELPGGDSTDNDSCNLYRYGLSCPGTWSLVRPCRCVCARVRVRRPNARSTNIHLTHMCTYVDALAAQVGFRAVPTDPIFGAVCIPSNDCLFGVKKLLYFRFLCLECCVLDS